MEEYCEILCWLDRMCTPDKHSLSAGREQDQELVRKRKASHGQFDGDASIQLQCEIDSAIENSATVGRC